jgi:hypothetical protein
MGNRSEYWCQRRVRLTSTIIDTHKIIFRPQLFVGGEGFWCMWRFLKYGCLSYFFRAIKELSYIRLYFLTQCKNTNARSLKIKRSMGE